MIWLPYHYHEGTAVVGIDHSERFKEMTISDSMIKIDDQEYNKFGLEIPYIGNCENLMIEGNVRIGINKVKNATIRDNAAITNIYNVENLTIEGDATINLDEAYELKNIDTTKSNKYHAENGILYEKVDGKRGKEIGKIFKECVDKG